MRTKRSSKRRDYICLSTRDKLVLAAKAFIIAFAAGRLFYDSYIAVIILLPLTLPYVRKEIAAIRERGLRTLGLQFRDAMVSVTTSLKAGYSIENAFISARSDMASLHGKDSMICAELSRIGKGLMNNLVLEELLGDLAKRSGQRDIAEFSGVFSIAKRSGGNMTHIMSDTIELIGNRMETEKEIQLLLSAKRMESVIMEVIPFFIIAYVGLTNRGFFAPLYHNISGIAIMTAALLAYLAAYALTERIVAVEI